MGNHRRKNHEISLVLGETFDPQRTGTLRLPARQPGAADHHRPVISPEEPSTLKFPPVAAPATGGRHRLRRPAALPEIVSGLEVPLRWSHTAQRATGVAAVVTVAIVIGLILNRDPALQNQSAADILIPPVSTSVTEEAPSSHQGQTVRDLLTKSTSTQPPTLEPQRPVETPQPPAVVKPTATSQQPVQTQSAPPPPQDAFCDTKETCMAYAEVIVTPTQLGCFQNVIMRESGWNIRALNYTSGAYGLAQALPAGKYASAGDDWRDNGATQLRWALDYMDERYGSPCGAWDFWVIHNWY